MKRSGPGLCRRSPCFLENSPGVPSDTRVVEEASAKAESRATRPLTLTASALVRKVAGRPVDSVVGDLSRVVASLRGRRTSRRSVRKTCVSTRTKAPAPLSQDARLSALRRADPIRREFVSFASGSRSPGGLSASGSRPVAIRGAPPRPGEPFDGLARSTIACALIGSRPTIGRDRRGDRGGQDGPALLPRHGRGAFTTVT